ncbi:hypothetical protein [Zhaonella formicivorans]|uniref:hypothetical protein n=1 Tax=Zhaonella formicivorans TaxID=2528593 RepID=UPI0010CFBF52|nr:hypothetical protein [Zhaonella formicivorans]
MEPKTRIWIDARKENLQNKDIKEIIYCIEDIHNEERIKQVFQAIGYYVLNLAIVQGNSLQVTYDPSRITPSFIDYLLHKNAIPFKRQGG